MVEELALHVDPRARTDPLARGLVERLVAREPEGDRGGPEELPAALTSRQHERVLAAERLVDDRLARPDVEELDVELDVAAILLARDPAEELRREPERDPEQVVAEGGTELDAAVADLVTLERRDQEEVVARGLGLLEEVVDLALLVESDLGVNVLEHAEFAENLAHPLLKTNGIDLEVHALISRDPVDRAGVRDRGDRGGGNGRDLGRGGGGPFAGRKPTRGGASRSLAHTAVRRRLGRGRLGSLRRIGRGGRRSRLGSLRRIGRGGRRSRLGRLRRTGRGGRRRRLGRLGRIGRGGRRSRLGRLGRVRRLVRGRRSLRRLGRVRRLVRGRRRLRRLGCVRRLVRGRRRLRRLGRVRGLLGRRRARGLARSLGAAPVVGSIPVSEPLVGARRRSSAPHARPRYGRTRRRERPRSVSVRYREGCRERPCRRRGSAPRGPCPRSSRAARRRARGRGGTRPGAEPRRPRTCSSWGGA